MAFISAYKSLAAEVALRVISAAPPPVPNIIHVVDNYHTEECMEESVRGLDIFVCPQKGLL